MDSEANYGNVEGKKQGSSLDQHQATSVDNGASLEEALTNIVGSIGAQNEQMSLRMSELERPVHVERESLREEINRNRQEFSRSEKRLKKRTDEYLAKKLSRYGKLSKGRHA